MTVTHVQKNPEALTLTITSEFSAPVEKVWQIWENPRLLERWWGPPTYPATMVEHDLAPGGRVHYFMTAPEGDRYHGWWRVLAIDAPHRLEIEDGFADDTGAPNPDLPVTIMRVTLAERPDGVTRMAIESTFASTAAMEQVLSMGVEEGMTLALNQIDALLTAEVGSA
jgi:uncharacterized protein YndB with AHSA1/START domain